MVHPDIFPQAKNYFLLLFLLAAKKPRCSVGPTILLPLPFNTFTDWNHAAVALTSMFVCARLFVCVCVFTAVLRT